jgi:glycosyltransferase involved in cell wall biosynthesis
LPKVLLDLRSVLGPLHGIARYSLELARRLPLLAPGWTFVGLTDPDGIPSDLGDLAPRIPLVKAPARFLSMLEQPALLSVLVKQRPDLFHATSFSVPALWPGPLVATLHDATHLALEETASFTRRAYYRTVVVPRANSARALITVSEFSRGEISNLLGISAYKLQVISNGVDALFHRASPEAIADFRERRGLPPRYVAALGNTKPHKNLRLLLPIADTLPQPLVLLAGRGARRTLGFSEQVIELAPLPDADLVAFYSGATCVLVPSRNEGFGLPALEAMACGAPVIAAQAGALPEVMGGAGMLLPPSDARLWKEAIQELIRDEKKAAALGAAGVERAARYTWEDCAQRTLAVYKRALNQ